MKNVKTALEWPDHYLNDADRFAFTRLFPDGSETHGGASLAKLRELFHFEHAVDSVEEGLATTLSGQYFHVWRTSERYYVDEFINNNGSADISFSADGCQKSYPTHYAILSALSKSETHQVNTFEAGCTLKNSSQVMYSSVTPAFYSWRGDYPKVVPPGSSPETAGGLGPTQWVEMSIPTFRSELSSPAGASYMGYAISTALEGHTVEAKLNNLVFIEDFKHLVSEDGDWQPAAQAAHDYARHNGFNKLWSFRPMAFKSPLVVDGWGQALDLRLSKVVAHDSIPKYKDWKSAPALITLGSVTGGCMVGLNIDIGFLDGKDVCNGIEIVGRGCGGSQITIGRATRCNIVYDCRKQTWPTASNFIHGKYWYDGNVGAFLARGTGKDTPIAEGHKLCVGFVTRMRYGAYLLRNGAQYSQISGDADFNGRHLSEVTLSGSSLNDLERGAKITNGTAIGEVLAFYTLASGVHKVLIIEEKDVSHAKSSYAAGDILTSGDWSSTVSMVRTAQQNENFFFDIILDFHGSAFAKVGIDCGYLGGIVGSALHSCSINYKNSFTAYTNSMNGAAFVHSGDALTLRDTHLNRVVFDCTTDYIANGANLFTRNYRTYGAEYAATFTPRQVRAIRTFAYVGSRNSPGVKDVYDVQVFGPTGLNGICSSFKVAVSPRGLEIYDSTVNPVSTLKITADGMALKAEQHSPNTFTLYFTFNRR
ncbi:tail fiber/spike domain-containing protein [Serratia ficaria]|uniref:tail fiber/spike domain-containing protein n=1 Tax=Serratia ficaria TaxID=61651 RepID=UPI00217723FD|nr:hypothetical protein [Serratia ficaria]CAI1736834.1 Uncharacterised protein [Serratia ficaria]